MNYDPKNPLSRIAGETRKANEALHDYYGLGMGRSFSKLEKKYIETNIRTRAQTIANWSAKYAWQDRVAAQVAIDQEEERKFWANARREIRMMDYKAAIELRERAERMRAFPIAETVKEENDGKTIIIIKPAGWREADISRIETTASDLARRAADMKKEKVGIDIQISDVDFSKLTDEQLGRIIAGEPIKSVVNS